jgi:hypothetical protein
VRSVWWWRILSIAAIVDVAYLGRTILVFRGFARHPWAICFTTLAIASVGYQCELQRVWKKTCVEATFDQLSTEISPLQSKVRFYFVLGIAALFLSTVADWFAARYPGYAVTVLPRAAVATAMAYGFLGFARRNASRPGPPPQVAGRNQDSLERK